MGISAVIFGCSGTELTQEERSFFQEAQPWGFIIFSRNVETPSQLTRLVSDLKECVEHDPVPILIDQEGGRVRRLRPPHWNDYFSAAQIGQVFHEDPGRAKRFAWLQSRLMAFDLQKIGINVDCLPVLDVPSPDCHDVIGDRAYSSDLEIITSLGLEASRGLMDGGVLPVIKHIPGHGRASADSHLELPRVDAGKSELSATDFAAFKPLSGLPLAMTAHILFSDIDRKQPATFSKRVIDDVIRGEIGFDGLLMCDALEMQALSGDMASRAHTSLEAGCDIVLHCNGRIEEMRAVMDGMRVLQDKSLSRASHATVLMASTVAADEMALRSEFKQFSGQGEHTIDPTEVLSA